MDTTSKWFSFKVERATGIPAGTIGAFPKLLGPIALLNTVHKIPTCFSLSNCFFNNYVWVWLKIRNNGREPPLHILETFSKMVLVESGFGVNAVDLFQGGNVGCRSNIEAEVEVLCNLHDVRACTFHGERKT